MGEESPISTMHNLNKNNFIQYCMHNYDNPQCHTLKEFEEDLNRISCIQRLFTRYLTNKDLNERLVINHLIILFNVFGSATLNILFFKLEKQYWDLLITFLTYLNRMPDAIIQYNIVSSDFEQDAHVLNLLRKL